MARPGGRAGGPGSARAPGADHIARGVQRCPVSGTIDPCPKPSATRGAGRIASMSSRPPARLLTSEGWQRWIRVRATNGLSRYSLRNQWLIGLRVPRPRDLAHLRRRLPRVPGSQPLCPQGRDRDQYPRPRRGQATGRQRRGDRREARLLSHRARLRRLDDRPAARRGARAARAPGAADRGRQPRHLIARLQHLAADLGYGVEIRELPEHHRQARTLVHELAHALGLGYQQYGRQQAEVLVDCVTYVVCSSVGLDVGGESIRTSPAGAKTAPSTPSASTPRPHRHRRAADRGRHRHERGNVER
jgi:hypothetical protein